MDLQLRLAVARVSRGCSPPLLLFLLHLGHGISCSAGLLLVALKGSGVGLALVPNFLSCQVGALGLEFISNWLTVL